MVWSREEDYEERKLDQGNNNSALNDVLNERINECIGTESKLSMALFGAYFRLTVQTRSGKLRGAGTSL